MNQQTQFEMPAYIELDEVVRYAGVPRSTLHAHLRRKKATRRLGNDTFVIVDKLQECEPQVYERLFTARLAQHDAATPTNA